MSTEFFLNLKKMPLQTLFEMMKSQKLAERNTIEWKITNEIEPLDLYCYLYSKYGPPNGPLSFLRSNDSDNLIHWDWTFFCEEGIIHIQGQNFRTEILLKGNFKSKIFTLENFISQIKTDINYNKKAIKEVKNELENWAQFINPYHRIQTTIDIHYRKLLELSLNPKEDKIPHPLNSSNCEKSQEQWINITNKYFYAYGISFGLRAMLPVLAESFVNLILFLLCKPEIKDNDRVFQATIRNQIDVRVQSLHICCEGFEKKVDFKNDICKKFHTLMNDRNDLLHGNIDIKKLSIGDIYFNGRVPIFSEYQDFWDKSIGVLIKSVKLDCIHDDKVTIENFINYILSLLNSDIEKQVKAVMEKRILGFNYNTKRIGILLPDHLVDFR